MFGLFKSWRRKELREAPFPARWDEILRANVVHDQRLAPADREKLRDDLRVFIAERDWEGCRGLAVDDEVRVTVAAQACILTLGLSVELYSNVSSILVYPAGYVAPERAIRPGGIVQEFKSHRIGEAWSHGPVVISWADALASGRGETGGHNVVFHEFAHQLDMRSGAPSGVPSLADEEQYRRWDTVMSAEFMRLRAQSESGEATLLDTYGATNGAEFFAVATECFFEQPAEMARQHPRLYDLLREYYRQDPARYFG